MGFGSCFAAGVLACVWADVYWSEPVVFLVYRSLVGGLCSLLLGMGGFGFRCGLGLRGSFL